ncbi:MAG: tRNA (adenine-N1)-methyltransferase [Candidatus Nanoarchaeia archaeon]|nr:tRNA (adenine-N1)-methyltransferase [Candidatus Nanoarchaeia archaeon]
MVWKLIMSKDGRTYTYNTDEIKKDFHTDFGVITKKDMINAKFGRKIKTHKGVEFSVIEPTIKDLLARFKRGPQIVTFKDSAIIAAYTGLKPGMKVVDGGAGSGVLASFLGNLVSPNGKVITYEIREDFSKIAKHNVKIAGLERIVKVKNKDMSKGIDEKNVDLVTVDVKSPWEIVEPAKKALKVGGFLVAYIPTVLQVDDFVREVNKHKELKYLRTIEIIERGWKIEERVLRPMSQMLAHTGFLIFVRKL